MAITLPQVVMIIKCLFILPKQPCLLWKKLTKPPLKHLIGLQNSWMYWLQGLAVQTEGSECGMLEGKSYLVTKTLVRKYVKWSFPGTKMSWFPLTDFLQTVSIFGLLKILRKFLVSMDILKEFFTSRWVPAENSSPLVLVMKLYDFGTFKKGQKKSEKTI